MSDANNEILLLQRFCFYYTNVLYPHNTRDTQTDYTILTFCKADELKVYETNSQDRIQTEISLSQFKSCQLGTKSIC
jgi:hypothetical protein